MRLTSFVACLVFCASTFAQSPHPAAPNLPMSGVDLVRDAYGVPHAFAASAQGACYGIGWATAQDRLFQLEFVRRVMRGRLSEILAPAQFGHALLIDKRSRLIGFAPHADALATRLDEATQALLAAYCDGVNDSVAALAQLPQIFTDLGIATFEPWTPADCLLVWMRIQDRFDSTWESEPNSSGCDGSAVIDPSGAVVPCPYGQASCQLELEQLMRGTPEEFLKASHNWAVAGSRTTTGEAILHSDPQIAVSAPSLWYELHLRGGAFDCRGIGLPGCPALLIGWNRDIAWGATALGSDDSDVYRLTIPVGQPNSYLLDGSVVPMTDVHDEIIKVKGGSDVTVTYKSTVWGPVVTRYLKDACKIGSGSTEEFALASQILYDVDVHTVQGLFGIMRARDWCEVRAALPGYRNPALHFLFADRHGNIGYTTLAAIPIRPANAPCFGREPLDGSTSASAWLGFIPIADLPWRFNPPEGFLSTANNMAADPSCNPYQLVLGGVGDTIRSWRLREILTLKLASPGSKVTPEEVLAMHNDSVNPAMRVFTLLALEMLQDGTFTPGSKPHLAASSLSHWNDGSPPEKHWQCLVANPIYTLIHYTEAVVTGKFRKPNPLVAIYGGGQPGLCNFLKQAEQDIAGFAAQADVISWAKDMLTQGWDSAQGRPIDGDTVVSYQVNLTSLCGTACSEVTCSLDRSKDYLTSRPMSCIMGNTIWSQLGNSYSQWINFADLEHSKSFLPPGVSEDPTSALYRNQEALWIDGQLRESPLHETLVRRTALSVTTLPWP